MSYKRLNARLKQKVGKNFDQLTNAFQAEGRALEPNNQPTINHPTTDYALQIEQIRQSDIKLGVTFSRLNSHQQHAVFHPAKHTILAAMVGSGKTTVLIAKIFYLHFIEKLPFEEMVVLTFTNKAAREIKERIATFLGNIDPELNMQLLYFGTFHSVARQLLQEHPQLSSLGFRPDFTIMDEFEKQEFLARIITQEGLDLKYRNQLPKRWRHYREHGAVLMGNMKQEDDLVRLIELAEAEKRSINCLDFDDLLTFCNHLLKDKVAQRVGWVIVDEFQDCNDTQLQLIAHLKGPQARLFVVGDQNQSIYGWRGSKEHIFEEVQSRWKASWMVLPHNYRSTENILSVAGSLLLTHQSQLIATRASGDPIALVRHFDDQQEAYYLREQLLSLQKEGISLDTVAILFRMHEQIKLVETVFAQSTIPFQLRKRSELYEDPAQAFLFRIFKLCINPNDVDACLALICNPTFGALPRSERLTRALCDRPSSITALHGLMQYLEKRKKPPFEHLGLLGKIEEFCGVFLANKTATTEQLIDYLSIRSILKPTSIHYGVYIKSIEEAWGQLSRYMSDKGLGQRRHNFHVAINQVALEGAFQINDRIKEKGHGVHLLTIHAAKGLEFDRVYIAGANTGVIPLMQHRGSQNLKEEKRLLFVGITRGKNRVEIGWHAQPTFRNAEPEPSYFLNAIPEALLERRVAGTMQPKAEQEGVEWTLNCAVKHKKYGEGRIIAVSDAEITCSFGALGNKSFSKAFAKALLVQVG